MSRNRSVSLTIRLDHIECKVETNATTCTGFCLIISVYTSASKFCTNTNSFVLCLYYVFFKNFTIYFYNNEDGGKEFATKANNIKKNMTHLVSQMWRSTRVLVHLRSSFLANFHALHRRLLKCA